MGWGQCIEHYGPGEAYLPVLDALGQLGRDADSPWFVSLLRQHAPFWLAQLPSLAPTEEREQLQRELQGTTRERMLREMATLLEALTAETTLVLVLEDLHWSDVSTLELLTFMARRQGHARLFIIGTYRPQELFAAEHPLRTMIRELHAHGECQELALEGLSEQAVTEYLHQRFPGSVLPAGLAPVLHRRTEGHPLFLVNLVEDLLTQGALVQTEEGGWTLQEATAEVADGVPQTMRLLIERQMERIGQFAQRMLAVASLVGLMFTTAAVAAAAAVLDVAEVELRCEELVRRKHFLRRAGIEQWPDGTVTARYGFAHAVYQQLWHERVTIAERPQLHQRIGERLEVAYGKRAGEIAATLAVHFQEGREYRRALGYLQQAAENALYRYAPREAIGHLTTALALLKMLPDTPARAQQELALQLALGAPLITTRGFAAPEVEAAYARARELCQQLGDSSRLFSALLGLWVLHLVRGELETAHSLGKQLLRIAHHHEDTTPLLQAHVALGVPSMFLGLLSTAREHLEKGIVLYDPQRHHTQVAVYGLDPGVFCRSYVAFTLMCSGYPDQARQGNREALVLARSLKHPYTMALAFTWAAVTHCFCGDISVAQEHAAALIRLSQEQEFPYWLGFGLMMHGWTLAAQGYHQEGREQLCRGLQALQTTGTIVGTRYGTTLLADVCIKEGKSKEGLAKVNEVLPTVDPRGERLWDAELYRLKGELILQSRVQGLGSSVQTNQKAKGKRQKAKGKNIRPPIPST